MTPAKPQRPADGGKKERCGRGGRDSHRSSAPEASPTHPLYLLFGDCWEKAGGQRDARVASPTCVSVASHGLRKGSPTG